MDKQNGDKIKLLLVEDDDDFRSALCYRLAKRNFEIVEAISAEEALAKIKTSNFDVVVSDIKLPGMSGTVFLSKVREFDNNLPVILVTGYASLESAKEAVRLNAADYILKPMESLDDLLSPVYKAVHNYKLSMENKKLLAELTVKNKELEIIDSELKVINLALERKSIALTEIIAHFDEEKNKLRNNISMNIENVLLPILTRLERKEILSEEVNLLKHHLKEINSSFGSNLSEKNSVLSSREIEICQIVKSGLTSKEISEMLNISSDTVEKHRKNIRNKLGLNNKNVNLVSYLQSL